MWKKSAEKNVEEDAGECAKFDAVLPNIRNRYSQNWFT